MHVDELTYAVITPIDEVRMQGGILESYQRISGALLEGLARLGLPVVAEPGKTHEAAKVDGPICFDTPARFEILAGGQKLVGSAQARRNYGVLQHGTIPLTGDLARITDALMYESEEERAAAEKELTMGATTVESALGTQVGWDQAVDEFRQAFGEILNLNLELGELTPEERERAEKLVDDKYGSESWTRRV